MRWETSVPCVETSSNYHCACHGPKVAAVRNIGCFSRTNGLQLPQSYCTLAIGPAPPMHAPYLDAVCQQKCAKWSWFCTAPDDPDNIYNCPMHICTASDITSNKCYSRDMINTWRNNPQNKSIPYRNVMRG